MAKLVKNDTPVFDCQVLFDRDPAVIHGRVFRRNVLVFPANPRPRSFVLFKGYPDSGIAVGDEIELDVGVFVPLLNDFLDFLLLNCSTTRRDERGGDGLRFIYQ